MKKSKSTIVGDMESETFSYKEKIDLFKLIFRNYVSLISVTDRKAGLLIHVNSIIISIAVAFSVHQITVQSLFILPLISIVLVAIGTIVLSILASKPLEKPVKKSDFDNDKNLFFGSFDRIDRHFKKMDWEQFENRIDSKLDDGKKTIFLQIKYETFAVRKVLSQKFWYISIAFKIFMYGLLFSLICFLLVCLKAAN